VTNATLTKHTSLRVWDISEGGCLLESKESLPIGTVGLLSLDLDGQQRREWFRVCRVHAAEGRRGTCLLAAEFLPLATAGHESVRGAMREWRATASTPQQAFERGAWRAKAGASGRSSGDPGNSTASPASRAAAAIGEHAKTFDTSAISAPSSTTPTLAARLLHWSAHARSSRAGWKKE
jgi:hypothetical protein